MALLTGGGVGVGVGAGGVGATGAANGADGCPNGDALGIGELFCSIAIGGGGAILVMGPAPESCWAKGDMPEAMVFDGIPPGNGRAPGRLLAGGGGGAIPGLLALSETPSMSSVDSTKSPM